MGEVILGMGVICAIFRILGNSPFAIHLLKISDNHEDKLLLQPLQWCCVECVIHHERDVHEEQHHSYMWRE